MDAVQIDRLWDYDDPAESEHRFRELLCQARQSGDPGFLIELQTQIARALCLQRQFDAAHAVLNEAEHNLTDSLQRPRLRLLLERGRILNDTHCAREALHLFQQAWGIAQQIDEHELGADALHMIAYVTRGEESLHWHQVAIEFCQNHDGERFRRWLCTLHMNTADIYEQLAQYSAGLESVKRSHAMARELDWSARMSLARIFMARLHRLMGETDQALTILREILQEPNPRGYAYEEHAECLLLTGAEQEARAQFKRAYELLSHDPWYPPTETQRLSRIQRLAGLG